VKIYCDTNVLIAAGIEAHSHHQQAVELLNPVWKGEVSACTSSHAIAEYFAVMTRLPCRPKIHPADADRMLQDDILPFFSWVELSAEEYRQALAMCLRANRPGAVIFDGLHLLSAQKAGCDRLYTFNVKDFRALAAPEWQSKIVTP